jgi:hypothetical protein
MIKTHATCYYSAIAKAPSLFSYLFLSLSLPLSSKI